MPTEVELTTKVEPGLHVTYTRRAVIPADLTAVELAVILDASTDLETTLRKYKFFEDDKLLFAADFATVESVNVTTHYEPVEETP